VFDVIVEEGGEALRRALRPRVPVRRRAGSDGCVATVLECRRPAAGEPRVSAPRRDDTIVGRVILTRQPYFLKDVELDPALPELSAQMIEALQTRIAGVDSDGCERCEPMARFTLAEDRAEGFRRLGRSRC
jgi:hypothetical protein